MEINSGFYQPQQLNRKDGNVGRPEQNNGFRLPQPPKRKDGIVKFGLPHQPKRTPGFVLEGGSLGRHHKDVALLKRQEQEASNARFRRWKRDRHEEEILNEEKNRRKNRKKNRRHPAKKLGDQSDWQKELSSIDESIDEENNKP